MIKTKTFKGKQNCLKTIYSFAKKHQKSRIGFYQKLQSLNNFLKNECEPYPDQLLVFPIENAVVVMWKDPAA